jgi:hypothetical protein
MTDTQWDSLLKNIEKRFGTLEVVTEDILNDRDATDSIIGVKEIVELETEHGTFRLVRETRPAVLGSTFHYSHQQGAAARREYIFSHTELMHKLLAYRLNDDGEWELIDPSLFAAGSSPSSEDDA